MVRKKTLLQFLIFFTCFHNQSLALEYGAFLEDTILIEKDNDTLIEKAEIQLSLKNLSYDFKQDIFKNSLYNHNNTILIDNTLAKTDDLFEFVGMFVSHYKSNNNLKIKVKFTKDAELDKGSIMWRVSF